MPIPTPKLPCHDAFGAAQVLRAQYPLTVGAYKLREALHTITRMQATMCAIGDYLRTPQHYSVGVSLGCCTTDDKAHWLKNLPKQVADMLGYEILPAIAALTGDGIAMSDVKGELRGARANARNLLCDCETQYTLLLTGPEREYRSMKKGYSDVYALLVDAAGIVRRALELIDWCEERERFVESDAALAEIWG